MWHLPSFSDLIEYFKTKNFKNNICKNNIYFTLFFLQVLSWIIYGGLFSYVKISIAGICRQTSNSALFWCGAVTQIGSAFGALLMFILVNVASGIFTSYYVVCEWIIERSEKHLWSFQVMQHELFITISDTISNSNF